MQTPATRRFKEDKAAQKMLSNTQKLASVSAADFDAIFYPGGHGPLFDLAVDPASRALIEALYAAGKPVSAVCHAPGVFRDTKDPEGQPLLKGKRVTGFTNSEEAAVGLTAAVPFLVEDMVKERGGLFQRGPDWLSFTAEDGLLITGQNPASSEATARLLLERLA